MNAGQYEGLMARLGEILDRMPVQDIPPGPTTAALAAAQKLYERDSTPETNKLVGACNALAAMKRAAEGWAEGSHENQVAMGHRDVKPVPDQEFVLVDILNMINDAAREVGVAPEYGSVE